MTQKLKRKLKVMLKLANIKNEKIIAGHFYNAFLNNTKKLTNSKEQVVYLCYSKTIKI